MNASVGLVLAIVALLSVSACGNGGDGAQPGTPPQIADLTYTPAFVAATHVVDSTVAVAVSVRYADSEADVESLTIAVADSNGKKLRAVTSSNPAAAGHSSGTLGGSVMVPTATAGNYLLQVSATDRHGSTSNQLTGPFAVVPLSGDPPTVAIAGTGYYPERVTVRGSSLYWTELSLGSVVNRVPAAGGEVTPIAPAIGVPDSLAFVGSDLVWLDERHGFDGTFAHDNPSGYGNDCVHGVVDFRILRVTHATEEIAALISPFVYDCLPEDRWGPTSHDLVTDGQWVYFARALTQGSELHGVNCASPGTAGAFWSANTVNPIVALAARPGTVYWMEIPSPIAPGGSHAVIQAFSPASVPSRSTVASEFDTAAYTFAVDDTAVYYTTPNDPDDDPLGTETLVAQPLAGGPPSIVSPAISTPTKLVADGGTVFWIDKQGVKAVSGGGATRVLATSTYVPLDLVISGGSAIWSESSGAVHGETGAIRSVPVDGGATVTLYEGGDAPRRLAVDPSGQIVWTEGGSVGQAEGFGRIARLQPSGMGQTLASGIQHAPAAFVVSDAGVFVADGLRIKRVPLDGGFPEAVAAGDVAVHDLVADTQYVYWVGVDAAVHRVPVTGGHVVDLAGASPGIAGPIRLAPDGDVYWIAAPQVLRVPATGGEPTVFADGQEYGDLAVDAVNTYLSVPSTGEILRRARSGGPATTLTTVADPTAFIHLALDGSELYWVDANQIAKISIGGGTPVPFVYDPGNTPPSLALDEESVYWTQWFRCGCAYELGGTLMGVGK